MSVRIGRVVASHAGVLLLAVLALAQVEPQRQPDRALVPPVNPHEVRIFTADLIRTLYDFQTDEGHWEGTGGLPMEADYHFGGTTALCTYALLAAGESPQNPRIRQAVDWLLRNPSRGVYTSAVRLNAFSYLPFATIREAAAADLQYLVRAQIPMINPETRQPNPAGGLYNYTTEYSVTRIDHSASQFAALGMWAADQMGMNVSQQFWADTEQAWLRDQNTDGGWSYNQSAQSGDSTGSMTAAGVATLFLTNDHLRARGEAVARGALSNEAIERGVAWLAKHFRVDRNPFGGSVETIPPYYWLYAVERVGLAGGLKYFGDHNWFDEGVRGLAARHTPGGRYEENPRNTAFALLFMARGQRPILVNKLRYEGVWNARPRDMANVTRWYGRRYESELLWQVVRIDNNVREFHDAPVLYIAGSGEVSFSAEERSRLRQYVQQGGLILAHADMADPTFAESFEQAANQIGAPYRMRELPEDHMVVSGAGRLRKPIRVKALGNGARELIVLIVDRDPSRAWQSQTERENPDAFDLAASIFFYASDKGRLRNRGDTHIVEADPAIAPLRSVSLARIQYEGNWDPEPGGWRRMAALLHNQNRIELKVQPVTLAAGALEGYGLAHLTGTEAVVLSQPQIQELRMFLGRGGLLLIDAAGGSSEFARAMESQLQALVPGVRPIGMSANDPLLADTNPLPEPHVTIFRTPATPPPPHPPGRLVVEYRRYARQFVGNNTVLQLRGVRLGLRWAIIFSPHDLSVGLVGHNVDGIIGYSPATATEIVRRIIVNSGK